MKQVIQDVATGRTQVAEVPIPIVQPGMVLVRTGASLVSAGTERSLIEFTSKSLLGKARSRPDLVRQVVDKARREGILTTIEAVRNRMDQPLPLGYSSAGVIEAVGQGVSGFSVGQRVACAGGGYAVHAEFAVVPRNLLALIPDGVDIESAAFTTLGAIALHGFRLGEMGLGDRVAVIGLGVLGLLAAQIARAAGCQVLGIDLDPGRVAFADENGIPAVSRSEAEAAAAAFTDGYGFDLVQICADTSSDDTVRLAGEIARDRGAVVSTGVVGIDLPRNLYFAKELRFMVSRSYGPGRYDPAYEQDGQDYPIGYVRWTEGRNLAAFLELLASRSVDVTPLVTHRFTIAQAEEAYQLITDSKVEEYLGVLLTYPDADQPIPQSRSIRLKPGKAEPEQSIRLGVIGAGNFARAVMLPVLSNLAGVELVGLASASGMGAESTGRKYGFGYVTTDYAELLSDQRVNTIAVLTRHHLHSKMVIESLKASKHVFCEKPLAISHPELEAIAETLQGSEHLLTVGFNRRFADLSVQLKSFLESVQEPLVMQYRVNAGILPPEHWLQDPNQGGGRIVGEACHFIDYLTFLAGELPLRVDARALPDDARYHEDNVILMVEFQGGSMGVITYLANGDRSFPKERVEVFGGGRVAVLDDFRRLELVTDGKRRQLQSRLRQDKGHRGEWDSWLDSIRTGGPPPIPYDELFAVSYASLAALDSLRSRQTVDIEPLENL